MKEMICDWVPHSVSTLVVYLTKLKNLKDLENLQKEPELQIREKDSISSKGICRAIDDTTLFVSWDYLDPLHIRVELMNKNTFAAARIERTSTGYFVARLSRHVKILLSCGRPFADIDWYWTRNRPPRVTSNVYDRPLIVQEKIIVKPAASEERLRWIFSECFGHDWADNINDWPRFSKGALRALFLKKLGADLKITEQLVEHLSTGSFKDHFHTHWVQMSFLYDYLQDDRDWEWAAKNVVPPVIRQD
jgi:hypothetical protein